MKKERIINIIFITIFAICIILPTVMVNRDKEAISLLENKKLATFPTWEDKEVKTFVSEFEVWFNDNVGFKEDAIILNICAKWALFRDLDLPSFIMGEDGHIFYTNSGNMINTFQGKDKVSDMRLDELSRGMVAMQDFYERNGAKFYFMPIPDKEQIYPEYYPKSIKRYEDSTKLDDLISYLEENTDVMVCNTKGALLNAKIDEPNLLYYKTFDTSHWNGEGAMVGYDAIMRLIKKDFEEVDIFEKSYWDKTMYPLPSTLSNLKSVDAISKIHGFEEMDIRYNHSGSNIIKDENFVKELKLIKDNEYHHYINKDKEEAPKVLLLGDSYIFEFLLEAFAENFSEVYLVPNNFDEETDKKRVEIFEKVDPDIVIYEFVERMISYDYWGSKLDVYERIMPVGEIIKEVKTYDTLPQLGTDQVQVNSDTYEISIVDMDDIFELSGWCVDQENSKSYGELYLKIGKEYYKAGKIQRHDIAEGAGNDDLLDCGFVFSVRKSVIEKVDNIEIIAFSNDLKYQYKPATYKIKK